MTPISILMGELDERLKEEEPELYELAWSRWHALLEWLKTR
jgi:hypothetical protein